MIGCCWNLFKHIPEIFVRESLAHDQIRIYNIRGAYDKFPDFFRMGPFIDSTRMKL